MSGLINSDSFNGLTLSVVGLGTTPSLNGLTGSVDIVDGENTTVVVNTELNTILIDAPAATVYTFLGMWVAGSYIANTLAISPITNNTYVSTVLITNVYDDPSINTAEWTLFLNTTVFDSVGIWVSGTNYNKNTLAISPTTKNTYVAIQDIMSTTIDPSVNTAEWTLFLLAGNITLNGLSGDITLNNGTNINIVPSGNSLTINQINIPVSNKGTGSVPLTITATTQGTAQSIGSLSLITTATYDINFFGTLTFTTNSNSNHTLSIFVVVGPVVISPIYKHTLSGNGNFATISIQGNLFSTAAGTKSITVKVFADSPNILTSTGDWQFSAIGNLA